LKTQNNFAQMFFDSADAFMIAIGSDEIVTDVNKKACEILGYSREEIKGKNWFDSFLSKAKREDARRFFHDMLSGALRHVHSDYLVITKQGEERIFSFHNILVSDEKGNIIGTLSSADEVTKLRQKEKALKEVENRLQTSLDSMIEGYQIIDYDWRYVYVNVEAAKQGRKTKEELLGYTMMQVYPGIENTEVFGYLRRCMTDRTPHQLENEFRFPDGSKGWFELRVEPIPTGILIFSLDITERKKAEDALRKSEGEYSSLFVNMMDGFAYCQMIFDEKDKPIDFIYLQINDAFERITGLKRENVVGKKVTEAIPGTEKANPELFDIYGRVALTGKNEKFEIFFKPLNLWLYVSVYCPMKGYFAAIFVDITERKEIEAELNKYRYRLEEVVAQRTAQCAKTNEELNREINEHQKMEEGLKLRVTILDNVREAIFLVNTKGDFAYANQAASKAYGYSLDEFLNMNIRSLMQPQDVHSIESLLRNIVEKALISPEMVHVRKDKSLMSVRVHTSLVKTLHGRFIVVAVREISD